MTDQQGVSPGVFAQAADLAVRGLPGSWELEHEESSRYVRRYRSRKGVRIRIAFDAARSHELDLWLTRDSRNTHEFALVEVLRTTACPPDDLSSVECLAPEAPAELHESLRRAVELLRTWASDFLAGKRRAYRRALRALEQDSLTYTAQFERKLTGGDGRNSD